MEEERTATYPRGWFVVGFSQDFEVGKPKELRYFGQRWVAYRGEDGAVRVLEAHCVHMGANLAHGGKVVGNDIECPFHAWRYCGTGECVHIPYAKRIPPRARQKTLPVEEKNGVVLVWHDEAGGPPDFEIPLIVEYGTDQWLPWSISQYYIKTHPREVVDNLADKTHFPAVHKTDIDEFGFEVSGHTATQRVKGKAYLASGGVDVFSSSTTYHGPAYLLMRMSGAFDNYMLFAHTPIDENSLDLRLAVTLKIVGSRAKTESYVGMYIDNLRKGFEDDMHIWENKIYRDPPLLCEGDGPIGQLRRWYKQFYRPRQQAPEVTP